MNFLFLSNKEVQTITGKGEKACYRLIAKIRQKYGKESGVPITLDEFCDYTHLKPEKVTHVLQR